jgi:hypothetical protein
MNFKEIKLIYNNALHNDVSIELNLLEDTMVINYQDIINTQFSEGNVEENEKYKKYLRLGMYSKAPCGGFVNFYKLKSKKGSYYVLYSGVNEVSNSHYIVTVHGFFSE